MRKIIYNQSLFAGKTIISSLDNLYKFILKMDGIESDIKTIIQFSKTYYENENVYPAPDVIRTKYKEFSFIEEKYENEEKLLGAVQTKYKEYRDNYRQELGLKYLEADISYNERLDVLDKINKLEAELMPEEESNIVSAKDYNLEEHYEKRKNKSGGIPTNIPEIDEITGGISSGKILVIGAKPGNGKTMQAINMCYMGLMIPDNNTMFMTMELPKDEFFMKVIKRHSYGVKSDDISVLKMLKGKLDSMEEKEFFRLKEDMLSKMKSELILFDTEDINLNTLFQFKNQLLTLIDKHNLKTIYLDYIQILQHYKTKDFVNNSEFLNAVVALIRDISVRKNVTFILLSQMTKESQKKTDKDKAMGKYSMADIMEISNLINFAYYIITFYMNDDLKMNNMVMTQLLKHRDGETREEPFKTFVKHNYFVIGELGNELGAMSMFETEGNAGSDQDEFMDLFGVK